MDDRIRYIKHQGKRILLIDLSHCNAAEMLTMVDRIQQEIGKHPRNSVVALTDFTGAEIDKEVAERMKKALAMDRPFVKRGAWVGTESLPKVYYENFKTFSRRDLPTFNSREEALEWLVKDD